MKVRPLRAGLLVALAGPFIGVLPLLILLIFIAGKYGPAVSAGALIRQFEAIIVFGYVFGGVPAIVAAVLGGLWDSEAELDRLGLLVVDDDCRRGRGAGDRV